MDATKDYELKITYMKDHLGRMWTRFNYMLGIQTAIAGGKFLGNSETYAVHFMVTGFVFALIWYLLGAQDRYLFELYREQVKQAFFNIKKTDTQKDLSYVGQVKPIEGIIFKEALEVETAWHTWRRDGISSTKMAAIVPMVIGVLWVVFFIWFKLQK